jgi:hypothetical protein
MMPAARFLLQRCLDAGHLEAPLVQWLARCIEVERGFAVGQEDVHTHIRVDRVDAGARACLFAHAVADGVLHAQGDEVDAPERRAHGRGVDAQRAARRKPALPRQTAGQLENVIFLAVAAVTDAPQHAGGDAAFQIDHIDQLPAAFEGDAAGHDLDVVCVELHQFLGQHCLEPARAGREELLVRQQFRRRFAFGARHAAYRADGGSSGVRGRIRHCVRKVSAQPGSPLRTAAAPVLR